MPIQERRGEMSETGRNFVNLVAALLAFLCIALFLGSCGNDDLIFPGDVPATSTPAPTATEEPA